MGGITDKAWLTIFMKHHGNPTIKNAYTMGWMEYTVKGSARKTWCQKFAENIHLYIIEHPPIRIPSK